MKQRVFSAGAIVVLAACSSGSPAVSGDPLRDGPTDGIFDNVTLIDNVNITSLPSEPRGKISEFITLNERDNATPVSDMPSGRATYDGDVVFEIAENGGTSRIILDGDLEMNVNFATGNITGVLDDIEGYDGNNTKVPVTGDLTMTATITSNTFAGQFQDDLTIRGNVVSLDGTLNGVFAGNDARDALGLMSGTASNVDGTVDTVTGVFFAEED